MAFKLVTNIDFIDEDGGGIIPQTDDVPIPHEGAVFSIFGDDIKKINFIVDNIAYSYDVGRKVYFVTVFCRRTLKEKKE